MDGLLPVAVFLAVASAIWLIFGRGRAPVADLAAAMRDGALVVDVRSAAEFATGHVRGATNIAVDELGMRVAEIGQPSAVVVYCASGMRSARAASILRAAGFQVLDAGSIRSIPPDLIDA